MVGGLKSFRTAWHQTSESSNKPPVVWKNTDSLGAFRRFWLEPKSVLPKHRTLGITPEIGVLINRRHLWGWIPNLPKNALGINHQILRWFLRLGCEKITSKTHNLYRFQQTILSLGEARMPCRELFVKTEKAKAKNNTSNRAGIYIYIYMYIYSTRVFHSIIKICICKFCVNRYSSYYLTSSDSNHWCPKAGALPNHMEPMVLAIEINHVFHVPKRDTSLDFPNHDDHQVFWMGNSHVEKKTTQN